MTTETRRETRTGDDSGERYGDLPSSTVIVERYRQPVRAFRSGFGAILGALLLAGGTTSFGETVYWTGGTSTDWANSGNWTNAVGAAGAPAAGDSVIIDVIHGDPTTNHPTLDLSGAAVTIGSLTLGTASTSTLTVSNGNVTDKKLIVSGSVTIGPYGTLTHPAGNETHRLFLDVGGNLTLEQDGRIDAIGNGFDNTAGNPGRATGRAGGGHGGEGGGGYNGIGGDCFGSITNPVRCGGGAAARRGGGVVLLYVTGSVTNNGVVTVDGESYAGTLDGGGAGGSVNIVADSIHGSGTISAKGGQSGGNGTGGGGGGRIAVRLTGDGATFDAIGGGSGFAANGGFGGGGYGGEYGAAGTIYLKTAGQSYGDLIVDNRNYSSSRTAWFTNTVYRFDTIVVTNRGVFELREDAALNLTNCALRSDSTTNNIISRMIFDPSVATLVWPAAYTNSGTISWMGTNLYAITADLTVGAGGILTHEANASTEAHKLNLSITGNLTVATGGAIDVSTRGLASGGQGLGTGRGGHGHGGEGGWGYQSTARGTTYGSITNPVTCGSGGGLRGGGVILIRITGDTVNDGTIRADGQGFIGTATSGGGAGGSVNLATRTITGSGIISADGGTVYDSTADRARGSGGGGRVAVMLTGSGATFADFDASRISARAGAGEASFSADSGAAGTVYLQTAAQGTGGGTVTVNNNALVTAARTHIPPAVSPVLDELLHAAVIVTNRGALAITASDRIASLTIASATEPLHLGDADTRLTVTGMLFPGDPPRPHGVRVNATHYPRLGFYSATDWNGYSPIPPNVSGDGDIWLRAPDGSLFQIR